jgi:hypothetical protein
LVDIDDIAKVIQSGEERLDATDQRDRALPRATRNKKQRVRTLLPGARWNNHIIDIDPLAFGLRRIQ